MMQPTEIANQVCHALYVYLRENNVPATIKELISDSISSFHGAVENVCETNQVDRLPSGSGIMFLSGRDRCAVMTCQIDNLLADIPVDGGMAEHEKDIAWGAVSVMLQSGDTKGATALSLARMGREKLLEWQAQIQESPETTVVCVAFAGTVDVTESTMSSLGFVSFVGLPKLGEFSATIN